MKNLAMPVVWLLCLQTLSAAEQKLTHQALFEPEHLVQVEIEMAPDDWEALRSQTRALGMALRKPSPPTPFTYFKADVVVDGQRIESVGIRKKGFVGSLDQKYPSLKIKFDEFVEQDPIDGLGRLTLNNNKQDPSVVSQFLAYRFYAAAKLPAPRCNFARVTVNGEYLGVYSNVESVKKPFLRRQFGSSKGKLYEGTLADFFVDRIEDFESKIGDEDNRDELRDLAAALNQDPVVLSEVEKYLDVDQFLRFWAMESLTNSWDGYANNQNNFFVYLDPADDRLHFIPWGADATCAPQQFIRSRYRCIHTKGLLARKLYSIEGIADRYRDTMLSLLEEVWDEDSLLEEVDRLEDFLTENLHPRQGRFQWGLDQTREFFKLRKRQMKRGLENLPASLVGNAVPPTYTKSVGTVKGTFQADWLKSRPQMPYEVGSAEIEMALDGRPVEFTKLGVYGELKEGNKGEDGTRTVVFVGKRKSNRVRITLRMATSESRYLSANPDRPIVVQGNLEEGGFGLFGILSTNGVRLVGGHLTVDEQVDEDDEQVGGSFSLDVVRFVEGKPDNSKPTGK